MSTSRQPRLITVSNRVAIPQGDVAAAGGLAVGVLGALEEYGGIWFGWNGQLTMGEPRDPVITRHGKVDFATIELNERDYEQYYNGFSNRVLWPICHYLLNFLQYQRADFDAYCRVNALFTRKLLALLEPDDVIWVHDYHLIPLAAELRHAGVENRIGFFLHVPFPSYDVFRAVPVHEYLLRSLCAYDVVGFQTDRDLMSFKSCVTQPAIGAVATTDNMIEVTGGHFIADVFPIGIDVDNILALAEQSQSSLHVERMLRSLDGRHLVIGVDRLDYSKGLTQRFLSYERLLEKYPHARQSLVYIQIAPPTRTGVRAYDEIRGGLEQTSGRINGRFAKPDWVPIRYLNTGFSRSTLAGFFRNAAVGLVTPIRDGMNLVAKEYVASQDRQDPGVLVLSSLAGAARELTEAVIVNPYDIEDVADGISLALSMSRDERCERHETMLATLRNNDITAWRSRFVEVLFAA